MATLSRRLCVAVAAALAALGSQLGALALVTPSTATSAAKSEERTAGSTPFVIPLRRESVPVKRRGKVVSFKTSYSGLVGVGSPYPQLFRVVFDTGSGHLVLPSAECASESCLLHLRYNQSASASAVPVNVDGSVVQPGEPCDQVNIGFGTGKVKGEFVRDTVCLSKAVALESSSAAGRDSEVPCVTMTAVMAVEMSTVPFKNFGFDGILGMGLSGLALKPDFSFFGHLAASKTVPAPRFAVFLTDGEAGEESEISIGGHNPSRLAGPLSWTPVAMPELGYWQVEIRAVRVGGKLIDVCREGGCRGVLDTGTSHLGIPTPYDVEVADLLTMPAGDMLDCRLADLPSLEIELPGINLTLHPDTYMRRLPLREDVSVDSQKGVWLERQDGGNQNATAEGSASLPAGGGSPGNQDVLDDEPSEVQRFCRPRLMPVSMPPPMGPKLFILGEPLLHKYYTVFDWERPQIGFGSRSADLTVRQKDDDRVGTLPKDTEVFLLQQQSTVIGAGHRSSGATTGAADVLDTRAADRSIGGGGEAALLKEAAEAAEDETETEDESAEEEMDDDEDSEDDEDYEDEADDDLVDSFATVQLALKVTLRGRRL